MERWAQTAARRPPIQVVGGREGAWEMVVSPLAAAAWRETRSASVLVVVTAWLWPSAGGMSEHGVGGGEDVGVCFGRVV